jgi:hypothetical protein
MPMAAPFQWGLLKAHGQTLRPRVGGGRLASRRFEPERYLVAAIGAGVAAACDTR